MLVNQQQIEQLAGEIANIAHPGDVILLYGTLGMGKTVFSRAFIRSLTTPTEEVPSPTFTLVQLYDTDKGTIWHFDLYRLQSPEEVFEIGLEEALIDGISLVEWPDKASRMFPKNKLEIHIENGTDANTRQIKLIPIGTDWTNRIKELSWKE
ncbi:MAG: tRNA (adenosine(37)-N6)-threonylcarbamoyltransferase complex ATPase subunit type 1 TsaE [Alphaproteobacteria bacterium]|nr:tRNA (adenosine(37)-N6)-threonylcarbamoyltransferase complex ATPase subunit type 1 TsaE [Alphaproteobacteria bacterium]